MPHRVTKRRLSGPTGRWVVGLGLWLGLCALSSNAAAAPFPARPAESPLPAATLQVPSPSPLPSASPEPDVYRELHPVRDPFMSRWQKATAKEMSGPGASPWYRDMAAQLDVTWRLAELAPAPVTLDTTVRDEAFDMVIAGAYSGWNATWRSTMRRSPELVPVQAFIQSALTPGMHVQKGKSGHARVSTDDQNTRNQRAAMADINQGPAAPRTPNTPSAGVSHPSLRTGSALTLIRLPGSSDLDSGAAPDSPFSPGLSGWVDVRDVLVDAARVQTRIQQNPEKNKFKPNIRWVAMARQNLMPTWSVVAELQGAPDVPLPTRNVVALEHSLVGIGLPAWAVRASAMQELRDDLGPDIREERVMVTARTNLAWYLPQDVSRWPLGQRPLAPGPILPELPPTGPGAPQPLARSPAVRTGATPLPLDGLADE